MHLVCDILMQVGFEHIPPLALVHVDAFTAVRLLVTDMARAYAWRFLCQPDASAQP